MQRTPTPQCHARGSLTSIVLPEHNAPFVAQIVVEIELLDPQRLSVEVGENITQIERHFQCSGNLSREGMLRWGSADKQETSKNKITLTTNLA